MSESCDIAVAGGGLAGMTAALALARDGWSVIVLDAGKAPKMPTPDAAPGLRVSTLTPAAINILRRLGVWSLLPTQRLQSFSSMRVWEQYPEHELIFRACDAGLPELGCVAENDVVLAGLAQVAEGQVKLRYGVRLTGVDSKEKRVRLLVDDGEEITCQLLVAADGGQSAVRQMLGIESKMSSYKQSGVVASVQMQSHQDTAWQRFLPGGPLALLPLPQQRCSMVWTCATDRAGELLDLPEADFLQQIDDASQHRFELEGLVGGRAAFALHKLLASSYCAHRSVLLGDAAHVVHPLAGQGANLGLLDAAALAEELGPLRTAGADPATPTALRRYARWRKSDNTIMVEALHQIWNLYAQDTPTLRGLRLLGARLLNGAPWLRGQLVTHAAGFGGQVPQLALPTRLKIPV